MLCASACGRQLPTAWPRIRLRPLTADSLQCQHPASPCCIRTPTTCIWNFYMHADTFCSDTFNCTHWSRQFTELCWRVQFRELVIRFITLRIHTLPRMLNKNQPVLIVIGYVLYSSNKQLNVNGSDMAHQCQTSFECAVVIWVLKCSSNSTFLSDLSLVEKHDKCCLKYCECFCMFKHPTCSNSNPQRILVHSACLLNHVICLTQPCMTPY